MSHHGVATDIVSPGKNPEKVSSRLTVSEVVEAVGFGKAQLLCLFTGGAVLFNRGVHTCLVAILTIPVAADLKLNHNQEGLLSSAVFIGMCVGTAASGYVGDVLGRRLPVCSSSIAVVAIGILSPLAQSFTMLLGARLLLGFAMAFGDVPVTALLSEISPQRWRIPMRAGAEAFFDLGYTYSAALASFADPHLRELQWRRLLVFASIPPGIMGILAVFVMPESPVWLASSGRREEAVRVFGLFKRLNGTTGVSVDYVSCQQEKQGKALSTTQQFRLIFGRAHIRMTLILAYTAFTLNLFYYGGMYAQPQVMTKGKGLAPGWEIVIGGPFDMIGIIVATAIAQTFPRRVALCFGTTMAAVGLTAFGCAGAISERSVALEVVYQFGVFSFYWVPAVAFIVFSQLAVESFPTLASATGGSIAFVCGRAGAMTAPMLFENIRAATGQWNLFCYLSAALCVLAVLMLGADAKGGQPARQDPYESVPDRRVPLADAEAGKQP